jgi:hypothetical protein
MFKNIKFYILGLFLIFGLFNYVKAETLKVIPNPLSSQGLQYISEVSTATITGDNLTANSPITITNGIGATLKNASIEISSASILSDGFLKKEDFSNFTNKQDNLGYTPENILNKSTEIVLGTSDTLYPTQNAVKSYVDNNVVNISSLSNLTSNNTFMTITGGTNSVLGTGTSINISSNVAYGVPILDINTKIPIILIPDSLIGSVIYQGIWDPNTNTYPSPTAKGYYWVVSSSGTYQTVTYAVGDWLIYNGAIWQKVDNLNVVNYLRDWGGSTSIDTLGTISTGTWHSTPIGSNYGGAGTINGVLQANGSGIVSALSENTAFNKNFETSTTNIKMNGSVNVGSSGNIADASHVHATDTSREPVLTKGNLTSTTSGVTITGGTSSVIGTGTTINIANSSATSTGTLTATDYNIFNSKEPSLTKGNLTSTTAGVTITGGTGAIIGSGSTINIANASATSTGTLTATDWGTFNSKSGFSEVNQNKVIFKSNVGNDSNSGLTINKAVLSIAQGINLATAQTPSFTNQWTITCFDADYDSNAYLIPYIHINAPALRLTGVNKIQDNSVLTVKDLFASSGIVMWFTGGAGTNPSFVNAQSCTSGLFQLDANQGNKYINIPYLVYASSTTELLKVYSGSTAIISSLKMVGNITLDGTTSFVDLRNVADISQVTFTYLNSATSTQVYLPITGSGTSGQVAEFNSKNSLISSKAYTNVPTASTIVLRDNNINTSANTFIENFTTTVGAGTTSLDNTSSPYQEFTGASVRTIFAPNATTMYLYQSFTIINKRSVTIPILLQDSSNLTTVPINSIVKIICIDNSTINGTWDVVTLNTGNGNTSINTLGTIATGTWQGSVIGASYGGAGTINGILQANGSGTVSALSQNTGFNRNFETTAANLLGSGTANVGTSTNIPRADHVHPRSVFTYYANNTGTQSTGLTAGSKIVYNSLTSDSGTGAPSITLGSNNFTLPTGFKYEFLGSTNAFYSDNTGYLNVRMYNNTSTAYFGFSSANAPVNNANGQDTDSIFIGEVSNTSGSNISVSAMISSVYGVSSINQFPSQGFFLKITATKL